MRARGRTTGGGSLALHVPATAHFLRGFWDPEHAALRSWCLNLQAPLRRKALGFDTFDHLLDVVVTPAQGTWTWKDGAAFVEARSRGLLDAAAAPAVRAQGERALDRLLSGYPPSSTSSAAATPRSDAGRRDGEREAPR